MAHGFTCAGMLPSQSTHMSKFSGLGSVGRSYIERVYQKLSYIEIVGRAAEQSMLRGVDEVQALPDYATKGEWVITDGRHDSTANAYHTQCLASQEVRREILASAQFLGLITLLLSHGNLHVARLFSLR